MKNIIGHNTYFSTYFKVDKKILDKYGAYDINLIMDTPLFIDPFLLFNNEEEKYQELHKQIIDYLVFLKEQARIKLADNDLKAHLKSYYVFPEVKECWLGYSKTGNEGAGLSLDFAYTLHSGLNSIIENVGSETISKSTHLEKLCLIGDKVDIDKISDFTANLIKTYLLEYTECFAKNHISSEKCKEINVDRAYFNYKTKTFASKKYYLPIYKANNMEEYVLLTPKNILRWDCTWINKKDFYEDYYSVISTIPGGTLRYQLETYIQERLYEDEKNKLTKQEKNKTLNDLLKKFPEVIDYYIKYKEDNSDEASIISEKQVSNAESFRNINVKNIITYLETANFYKDYSMNSFDEAVNAVKFLKIAIEENGLYRDFYDKDGNAIEREEILNNMYRLCFRKSHFLYNGQVNNGNGPCDGQVSFGSDDCTIVEFKLAKSSTLRDNLKHQTEAYCVANHTDKKVKVILYFNNEQLTRALDIIKDLDLNSEINKSIFLIDANNENKISASKRNDKNTSR